MGLGISGRWLRALLIPGLLLLLLPIKLVRTIWPGSHGCDRLQNRTTEPVFFRLGSFGVQGKCVVPLPRQNSGRSSGLRLLLMLSVLGEASVAGYRS